MDSGLRSSNTLGKNSLFTVGEIKTFTVPNLDLESFLLAKAKIRQEGLLDSTLKTNLDFALQATECLPASKRRDVSLTVEGERQLVRLTAGTPVLHYTVRPGPRRPQLYQKVQVPGSRLTASCLDEAHFAGHCCSDELESCFNQARRALTQQSESHSESGSGSESDPSVSKELELRIECQELHLTYATQRPRRTLVVMPRRRAYLGKVPSLERVLELKCQLEKSGEMGKSLLVCFQHLLLHYGDYQEENSSRVVLQGDGQMVELISGSPDFHSAQHYIFTDAHEQAHSRRVQDVDLWEYD